MEHLQNLSSYVWDNYKWALTRADERVAGWMLMSAYWPTLAITATYVLAVVIGPKLMQQRQPFHFRWTLFFYNLLLVIMNFHICRKLFAATWKLNYSYSCQMVNYGNDPDELKIAEALWWFYFSKMIEFLDTVFFILRKKDNQVSFLHVYHHATMFPLWWIGIKWVPGGQSFFGAMLNSFVHVIMYTYYGVAALGPKYQKYLWWKKYLTMLQLVQFVVGIAHAIQSIYVRCPFPMWMQWLFIIYGFTILGLFLNFYFRAYVKPPKDQTSMEGDGQQVSSHIQNGKKKHD